MKITGLKWESENVTFEHYKPMEKKTNSAVLIFPGGAYVGHADHEGQGYAEMFNSWGMNAFVLKYSVMPNYFPKPLLDARRAIRWIRSNAEELGIDKNQILVMGSSAGGHLASMLSTYTQALEGEETEVAEDFLPNGQILCYPVVSSDDEIGHMGSYIHLLGDRFYDKRKVDPIRLAKESTPKAFIWHTSTDSVVNVVNSYHYAEALANKNVSCELHVYPIGEHGSGRAEFLPYIAKWTQCLEDWLKLNQYL